MALVLLNENVVSYTNHWLQNLLIDIACGHRNSGYSDVCMRKKKATIELDKMTWKHELYVKYPY